MGRYTLSKHSFVENCDRLFSPLVSNCILFISLKAAGDAEAIGALKVGNNMVHCPEAGGRILGRALGGVDRDRVADGGAR